MSNGEASMRSVWTRAWRVGVVTTTLLSLPATALLMPSVAYAASSRNPLTTAGTELDGIEKDIPAALSVKTVSVEWRTPEQMLVDGDLLFRLRDYTRAILVFSQVIEKYKDNKPAYAEAVYRCGEALYASHDYLSARTKFGEVAAHGRESEYRAYASRSVARLVDIALRVDDPRDPRTGDDVLAKINALAPGDVDSTILYAKGKVLFFRSDLEGAKTALAGVGAEGGFLHQAKYLLGVVAMRQSVGGKYASAIDTFRHVTELPGDSDEHKLVVDLSWLAIGRLFYEMDQLDQSVLAYEHVDRDSKVFDTMLYEIAWVYVRQEDHEKATRALDMLSLTAPDSAYSVEGDILKADILLRKAEFKKALEGYEKVRDELDPVRKRIDAYLASGKTASEYYERLVGAQLDALDGPDTLPPLVIRWAKEQQDGQLAFAVVESVQQTRDLLTQSQTMLDKLQAVVRGTNKVKAFPELRGAYEAVVLLLNRLSHARAEVGVGLDDVEPADLSAYPQIVEVQVQRRRLQAVILGLPVDDDGFTKREAETLAQWRGVSQQLQQRQVEIDLLQGQVNALRRYLKTKTSDTGAAIEPARLADYQTKIDALEKEVAGYREEAAKLRSEIEKGRAQIGIGDDRYLADETSREQYRELLEREIALVAGQLGGSAKAFAAAASPVLERARTDEAKVMGQKIELDRKISALAAQLQATLDGWQAELDTYRKALASFDDEARGVIGEVAKRNFGLVRDRLTTLVMRAEVGITDQAWYDREVRKGILRDRQIEKGEQERLLDEEMKQIESDGSIGLE
ncbi:MAG: hypothetical protein ACHREM_07900 [Polyangiales bacterium]